MACWLIEKLKIILVIDYSVNLGIEKEAKGLSNNTVTKLSPFPLIYLYRQVFLAHKFIKMKNRNRIDVEP